MMIGDEIMIFDWFRLHFVENEGMAFGMTLGGSYGKVALTLFRLLAVVCLGYMLRRLAHETHRPKGFLVSISLIMAGAIGNIIDSIFYGILFSHSNGQIATLLPDSGGYAPLLHGKVVDMFWFPLYDGFFPEWLPVWGGTYFSFFRPVFNVADTAITIGVVIVLLFQRSFFAEKSQTNEQNSTLSANIDNESNQNNDTSKNQPNDDMPTDNNLDTNSDYTKQPIE